MRPMNDKEREELYHRYIGTFGGRYQAMKAVEECAELTAALMHFFADRARLEDLITEIADVQIMCEQLALMFGQAEVEREKQRKLERMKERLTGQTHTDIDKEYRV